MYFGHIVATVIRFANAVLVRRTIGHLRSDEGTEAQMPRCERSFRSADFCSGFQVDVNACASQQFAVMGLRSCSEKVEKGGTTAARRAGGRGNRAFVNFRLSLTLLPSHPKHTSQQ
jgi:hypothetical protein